MSAIARIKEVDICIGTYYELPDGRIVRTYAWDGRKRTVSYYFDDDSGTHVAMADDVANWKLRNDLGDFPNARDPRLPYVFDLFWNIKTVSHLKREIVGHDDEGEMRDLMAQYDIEI